MPPLHNHERLNLRRTPATIDFFSVCSIFVLATFLSAKLFDNWAGSARFILITGAQLGSVVAYLKLRNLGIRTQLCWLPPPRETLKHLLVMAIGAMVLLDELDRLIGLVIALPDDQAARMKEALTGASLGEGVLIMLGVGVCGAVVEESVFRGFIQQFFLKRVNATKAVLWTSLLFTVMHLKPWWFIQLIVLSCFLGYLAWRWNSILPAAAVHAANNIWSLLLMGGYLPELENHYLWNGQVHPVWIMTAVLLFWYGFWKSNRYIERNRKKVVL